AAVEPAPAPITIVSAPSGAQVLDANGTVLGETPLSVPRPAAGQRVELVVREEGHAPHTIALSARSAPELRVVLERRPAVRRARRAAPPPQAEAAPPAPAPAEARRPETR